MKFIKESSIVGKMFLSYCLLIVIFVLYGLLSFYDHRTLFGLTQNLFNHPLVVSNAALQANVSIAKMHRNMKDVVLFKTPDRIKQSVAAVEKEERNVYKNLDIIKSEILGSEGKHLEGESRILFDNWRPIRSRVIQLVGDNQTEVAAAITLNEGANHVLLLEQKMLELTRYARNKATLFMTESQDTYHGLIIKSSFFLFLGIALSLAIALFTLKRIVRTENALIESEEVYRSLVESQIDLICRVKPDGKLTYVNKVFCDFFDKPKESLIGTAWKPVPVDDDLNIVEEKLASLSIENPTVIIENRVRSGTGKVHWVQFIHSGFFEPTGDLVEIQSVGRNITGQKQSEKEKEALEAQYRQAQKMESIGRLAGGVAHDYNNALSSIIGFTELALDQVDPTGPVRNDLHEVLSAARRATKITKQLLAFARKQTIAPKAIDLNDNIEKTLKMLRHLIGEDIDLNWLPDSDLWAVKMDPSQLDQILANLCVNARDAIDGVGKVTIETNNAIFDEAYCANHNGFSPGEYVMLAISDNGCGIEKEHLDKIFEPFFTTKDVDKGTGLGLSTVYGIVKQNEGFVNIYSEVGSGTTIRVYLSRYYGEIEETQEEFAENLPLARSETVLVVEDDLSILKLAQQILVGLGYKVITEGNPKKAINLAKNYQGDIDLLVTDVIMPDMNGLELAVNLQSDYPELKRLFMSGYTANTIAHHGVLDEGVLFIQKPFAKADLATMVRKALDEA
ncbi:ATP-binding protein [Desulfopila sp. IMCC35008]|uniref:ATP-binding protein n=1 Tax=Desulfopila sp. IMCC35008 TaxID=2653858 RepID=UPI0013D7640E|nr:ATP-binding protein [Desulfopila sp. IMCC35008]